MNKFVKTIATVGALALCACGQSNAEKQKEKCMNHDTCVIELNNGVKMPAFGLGKYQLSEKARRVCAHPLTVECGFPHPRGLLGRITSLKWQNTSQREYFKLKPSPASPSYHLG